VIVVIAIVVPVAVTTSRNKPSSDQQTSSPLSSSSSVSSTPTLSSALLPSGTPIGQGSSGDDQGGSGGNISVSSGKTEQGSSDDGAFPGSSPVGGG